MSDLNRTMMSDTVPGQDCRPEPPTLDELQRAHDWRTERRADGRYIVDVCLQCGHEESAARRGPVPDCSVREVPERLSSLVDESEGEDRVERVEDDQEALA